MDESAPTPDNDEQGLPDEMVVYVVDDDVDVRLAICAGLTWRGYVVQGFASAREFLAETGENVAPGCLVLDLGMPVMDGLELQELLARRGSDLPVIFISGHAAVNDAVKAMRAGAIDFLEKPFAQSALVERIEEAFAGLRRRAAEHRAQRGQQARLDSLTVREIEVVRHMLGNPDRISSKQIAQDLGISPRTVDHHRARILEKLGVGSVAELFDMAHRLGWG
ncbi:MAG: response regulator [Paracoccus sp. (in: a-proteobacteria)]|uniref:response regulator transcription factor n=1 Tax=Paracoccus sp. TaxID=267 RepID=UPI0039E71666